MMDQETGARFAALQAQVDRVERAVAFLLRQLNMEYIDEPSAGLPENVQELVRDGKIMEAIQAYRDATGANLAEAKSAVMGADTDRPL